MTNSAGTGRTDRTAVCDGLWSYCPGDSGTGRTDRTAVCDDTRGSPKDCPTRMGRTNRIAVCDGSPEDCPAVLGTVGQIGQECVMIFLGEFPPHMLLWVSPCACA